MDGTDRLLAALERNAVLADRIVLRARVRALPVASEDGLWVRTQVERLLDDVADVAAGPDTLFPSGGNADLASTSEAAQHGQSPSIGSRA